MNETKPGDIHSCIIAIMQDVGPIAKSQKNVQQNFMYRGVDDVYNACHPLFAKHGVYSTSEILDSQHNQRQSDRGTLITHTVVKIRFTYWARDGSNVSTEVVAEGQDHGSDKASNKAMSAASKYALLQLLQIPTAMIDPDKAYANPDQAETPKVQPRAMRVEPKQLSAISDKWKSQFGTGKAPEDRAAYAKWVEKCTGRAFNVFSVAMWTSDDVDKCTAVLGA